MGSKNPVEYAEQKLGVHTIWDRAKEEHSSHDSAVQSIKSIIGKLRVLREELDDCEREAAAQVSPEGMTSKTALRDAVKAAIDSDSACLKLRRKIAKLESEKSSHDLDARHARYGIELYSARLHELGGLLNFYAAAKTNNPTTKGS